MFEYKNISKFALIVLIPCVGGSLSTLAAGNTKLMHNPQILATGAGTYEIVDKSKILLEEMKWSSAVQQQDQQAYEEAQADAERAYLKLRGDCVSEVSYKQCSGLALLERMSIDTMKSMSVGKIAAGEHAEAIRSYKQQKQVFKTKLAAIAVLKDVWAGNSVNISSDSSEKSQRQVIYNKGALNLDKLEKVYLDELGNMDKLAMSLQYKVGVGVGVETTQPGMGLDFVQATETPEALREQLDEFQKNAELSDVDKLVLANMIKKFGTYAFKYIDSYRGKLEWFNNLQTEDGKSWVEGLENKARVLNYTRALYCMPVGVPGLRVSKAKKINLSYISRGVLKNVTNAQKSEVHTDNIRATMKDFDLYFTSAKSQGGQFNHAGGIMGFINKVNSTFTWHNEVQAYLNVMKILRDGMLDEISLNDEINGCEVVRSRYEMRYGKGSLRDRGYLTNYKKHLEGTMITQDDLMLAFKEAGKVILTKGLFMGKVRKFQKEHPGLSLVDQAFDILFD